MEKMKFLRVFRVASAPLAGSAAGQSHAERALLLFTAFDASKQLIQLHATFTVRSTCVTPAMDCGQIKYA
jgi:hypothetical protein